MTTLHDDQSLLARWSTERDAEAFKTLMTRYGGMVYGVCRRMLGNETEAEDVSQECFEALSSAGTKPGPYLGAWLHRVAVFLALNRLKKERRRKERETRFAQAAREPGQVAWSEIYAYLDEAVAELPEKNRVALVSYFYTNETQEAIGTRLGVSRQVVAYRIDVGIERIRKTLKKKGIHVLGVALAALVKANIAEAAPASLVAKLGRLALVGPGTLAPPPLLPKASGVWTSVSKGITAAVICGLVTGGSLLGYRHVHRPYPTQEITSKSTFVYEPQTKPAPVVPTVADAVSAQQAENTQAEPVSDGPPTMTVCGQLLDERGRPVPGATVTLDNRDEFLYVTRAREKSGLLEHIPQLVEQSQTTDGQGRFLFPACPLEMRGRWYTHMCLKSVVGKKIACETFRREVGVRRRFVELVLCPNVGLGGRVMDEAGHAIAGANVAVSTPGNHPSGARMTRETAVDGTWRFADMPEGTCGMMTASADGYAGAQLRNVPTGQKNLDIVLSTGNYIEGRLVEESGAPLAGISVAALGIEGQGHSKASDAEGRFHVGGLSAGAYRLSLRKAGEAPFTYYIAEPVTVTLAPDRPATGIEVRVAKGAAVSGRVLNELTGAPFEHVNVAFSAMGKPSPEGEAISDETGMYVVGGLPVGNYQVRLKALDWDTEEDGGSVLIDTIRHVDNVDFRMQPPPEVTGIVIDATGNPVAGASVMVSPTGHRMPFGILADNAGKFAAYLPGASGPICLKAIGHDCLSPMSGHYRGGDYATLVVEAAGRIEGQIVDDAGNRVSEGQVKAVPNKGDAAETDIRSMGGFEFAPLLPGFYRLEVFLPGCSKGYPAATARAEVRPGQTLRTRLRVSFPGSATVEGRVVFADAPVPNAEVFVYSEGWTRPVSTRTDDSGHYTITNLPGGTANVTVSTPRALEKRVELVAGEVRNLDFAVAAPECGVEGTITQNGEPALGAFVVFRKTGSEASEETVEAMTDLQGHFHSEDLHEGTYEAKVRWHSSNDHFGSSPALTAIETKSGETVTCDLALCCGTVEGTVTGLRDGETALVGFFAGNVDLATVPSLGLDIIRNGILHGVELMPGMPLKVAGVPVGLYYIGAIPADAGTTNPTPEELLAIYLKGRYALVQVEVEEGHTTALDLAIP